MKTQIMSLAAMFIIGNSNAQSFKNVSLQTARNSQAVAFTIDREANVRHYRVEASNDGANYKVIGTMPSRGNSVVPANYKFDISAYSYAYYRVGMVEMNGQMPYSDVVKIKSKEEGATPADHMLKEERVIVANH